MKLMKRTEPQQGPVEWVQTMKKGLLSCFMFDVLCLKCGVLARRTIKIIVIGYLLA